MCQAILILHSVPTSLRAPSLEFPLASASLICLSHVYRIIMNWSVKGKLVCENESTNSRGRSSIRVQPNGSGTSTPGTLIIAESHRCLAAYIAREKAIHSGISSILMYYTAFNLYKCTPCNLTAPRNKKVVGSDSLIYSANGDCRYHRLGRRTMCVHIFRS